MGIAYDANIRHIREILFREKELVESALLFDDNKHLDFSGDLRRVSIFYDVLLSHFDGYVE